ncbi:hypothetical protein GWI33_000959 [Rhynchophorus ferrugineus]|uniref:Uncharacterized protein n=1 Tax=Rhynchophorus ferrugineus TaxID=354439 RepID=A0A834HMB1_RHYFE|nr:hypothetical protein GWI33_000962 [Rhynchophorus ferrugineus]KAF7263887.1 hypothetical protein GWI33_000959 [Rhynchophorus ferrugineus]
MRSASQEFDRPENPKKGAGIISTLTFWYALKTFLLGRKRDLDEDDLTKPLEEHKSSLLGDKLARNWSYELRRAAKHRQIPSLHRVIVKTFRFDIIFYGVVLFIMEIFVRMSQPIFIGLFIRFFNTKNKLSKEA